MIVSIRAEFDRASTLASPSPLTTIHHFLKQKIFFHVKSENIIFLHVNNVWDFSLFIEQNIDDKR